DGLADGRERGVSSYLTRQPSRGGHDRTSVPWCFSRTSLPTLQIWSCAPAGQRPVQLCHMPSSKTARLAAFSKPLSVIITSVEVTWLRAASGGKLPPASTCAE